MQPPQRSGNSSAVIVLGILSLVGLPILGPVAWLLGNRELRAIDTGIANPVDRGNVVIGRICGMIGTGLLGVLVIYLCFMLVAMIGLFSQFVRVQNTLTQRAPAGQSQPLPPSSPGGSGFSGPDPVGRAVTNRFNTIQRVLKQQSAPQTGQ